MRRHIHTHTESDTALCAVMPLGARSGDMCSSSAGILAYLGWMRLWLSCLSESFTHNMNRGFGYLRAFEAKALQEAADIASGKNRAPALIPESARVAQAPKIMLNRRAKRILARGLPACRQYGWFRYASPRTLSGNQFLELVAKLSVNGRMGVYRLEYKRRLCTRRPLNVEATLCPLLVSSNSVNLGYSAAHLWPN